jgi:HEAT repeat protein
MSQQPVLRTVIEIGESAIPKLSDVLRNHPDWRMRMYAVYCISISGIGGSSAVRALKEALPSQSDACVKRFVQVSIEALNNNEQRIRDTNYWFGAFMCSH